MDSNEMIGTLAAFNFYYMIKAVSLATGLVPSFTIKVSNPKF